MANDSSEILATTREYVKGRIKRIGFEHAENEVWANLMHLTLRRQALPPAEMVVELQAMLNELKTGNT